MDDGLLRGRVAIITGGGSGIGAATARRLARSGVEVVIAGRRRKPLETLADELRDHGGRSHAVVADLTDEAQARRVVATAMAELGRLDYAVNAAGAAAVGPLVETDESTFDGVLAANVKTTWTAMKHEIAAMTTGGGGAIVNVASRAGLTGTPGGSVYSAAKHAVVGLTRSAALETAGAGIRINVVCPGPTRTDQFTRIVEQMTPPIPVKQATTAMGAKLPLGRIAEPEEIAEAITWLLGPQASFMTGAAIPVDGGAGAG